MLTVADFLAQYKNYSDVELYKTYVAINDYSDEAQEAIAIEIEHRGGIEKLEAINQQKVQLQKEAIRIRQETVKLYGHGTDISFLKTLITSELLPPEQTHALIEQQYQACHSEKADEAIKPRTIWGSLLGGALGSVIGGVIWGLLLIQTHKAILLLIAGLAFISYGFIRLFTKQSRANIAVVVATVLSVVLALVIGQELFFLFG